VAGRKMNWEKDTEQKFHLMIEKVPVFLRDIAREKVSQKAALYAQGERRPEINEKDLVNAFFDVTPFGFHGPMKTDMETIGIDYTQYGHQR
jgi:hypothetical protein